MFIHRLMNLHMLQSNIMENIFTYGTLQNSDVQQNIIGRVVTMRDDILPAYTKSEIKINGRCYPIAVRDTDSQIVGKLFTITQGELLSIDKYETTAYKRVSVTLASGQTAWIYC